MNADNWHVRTATGESIGPLSEAHVREMLLRTTDLQGTKVRQGNSAWIDASYVLNRFKELMERGVYLAHQNQTLGPFTTEHANNLLRQHVTISKYRIGENGEWKALDSSRTLKAPADKAPEEPQPSPKPKQATPAPEATPANLGVNLADLRLETGVPIQRSVEDSSTQFDPYRVWLGLPKELKHPTYYHILGITQGESSVDVIRSAIEQRRSYILSKRGEGHDGSVQQILSMIEEAAATLLVPEFKHGYDRYLGIHFGEKPKRFMKAMLLPPWMESRVVRVYGEGSGLLVEVLGLVAILIGAFVLMAWMSFQFPWQKMTSEVASVPALSTPSIVEPEGDDKPVDWELSPEPTVPKNLSNVKLSNDNLPNDDLFSNTPSNDSNEEKAPAKPSDNGITDPVSYALGFKVGSDMRNSSLEASDFDVEQFTSGFLDGLAKNQKLTPEQMRAYFMLLEEKVQKRKDEIQKKNIDIRLLNLEKANEFLKVNKDKEGIQTTKSGLQYKVINVGTGKTPTLSSKVKVHYEGRLLDGTIFDSSIKRGKPIEFQVNGLISGWTEALQRMKVGDKWRLFIPPNLAYGEKGSPPAIGPNELLAFEVELLEVK